MLRCQDISEMATDYMEHALPVRRRLAMRFHLALCSMCRAYIDQLRKARRLLGRGHLPPPPAAVEQRILAAAARPPAPHPSAPPPTEPPP